MGYSSSTGWFANVFTAQTTRSLSAVGFYTLAPGTSYEVYTGSSLATKTLSTSGTLAYMGYHTVTLPTPVSGDAAASPSSWPSRSRRPEYNVPDRHRIPDRRLLQRRHRAAGQSYVSSTGSSWTDLTAA